MLSVRCKMCRKELTSTTKTQCCGCRNQMTVREGKITAVDLSEVILINSVDSLKSRSVFSKTDLQYQESRRQRRVRKLDFEER